MPADPALGEIVNEKVGKAMKTQLRALSNELTAAKQQLETIQKNLQSEKAKRRKLEKHVPKESQINVDLVDLSNLPVVAKKKTTRVNFPATTLNTEHSNQIHTPHKSLQGVLQLGRFQGR